MCQPRDTLGQRHERRNSVGIAGGRLDSDAAEAGGVEPAQL